MSVRTRVNTRVGVQGLCVSHYDEQVISLAELLDLFSIYVCLNCDYTVVCFKQHYIR